jgi:glutathione-independent formaldehyde dehydrogenase
MGTRRVPGEISEVSMKAVVYNGAYDVELREVPDPRIEHPADAIVRITTTNICGSDLHMYEGRTTVEEGKILGHENMGIVEEVGPAVFRVKKGERVSVPFNIACGVCRNCVAGWTSFCLNTNPTDGVDGAAYGYANMGPYDGGQAEYLRVPFADFNLLQLPPGDEHELDFTMLSDIFPTGYHGTELAEVRPGHTVAVFGAGPVGLMAAHSAFIRGASRVFVVDKEPDRLRLAESIGAEAIDISDGDPVGQITEANRGEVDRGVEAVGYQAHDPSGEEHPELVLDNLVKVVRTTGAIGVVGVYMPEDPGANGELAKEGRIPWQYGQFFTKGQRMGTGQCPVKRYNRELRDLIIAGKARPSFIVSHELTLDEAPAGYDHFDKREDGWTKVLLHPAA